MLKIILLSVVGEVYTTVNLWHDCPTSGGKEYSKRQTFTMKSWKSWTCSLALEEWLRKL